MQDSKIQPDTMRRVLVAGATGYIGGRLLPELEKEYRVRCLVRSPEKLEGKVRQETEVCRGDVLEIDSLREPMQGVDTAYYLIHLMGSVKDFEKKDRQAAENFSQVAKACGVRRIVYMGGLGDDADGELSPHLRSRQEVGRILRDSGVPTIEFRASIVIGSGSLSFELLRSLTDRLPVMICPRWLTTPAQPIAVDDVVEYLVQAARLPFEESAVYEIGGEDVVAYGDLIREYARQQGKRRWLIRVPILTPYLSSLWLGLVTPASAEVGRHLVEGLRNPTVVHDRSALQRFDVSPMGTEAAIRRALLNEKAK